MKAFQIKELKNFMSRLLASDSFDSFLLEEAVITTYNSFVIDGHINKDFYSGDENESGIEVFDFSEWANMRGLCFDLIKGKRTPLNFKFVLHLKPELVSSILQQGDSEMQPSAIRAFVLNIKYDGSTLTCVSATSMQTFLPDKTPDLLWDAYMASFFDEKNISYEYL